MSDSARVAIIIVAAGSGTRLGASVPKAFVDLGGLNLLQRSVRTALRVEGADIVVVVPVDRVQTAMSDVAQDRVRVIAGGATRQASVVAGLAHLRDDVDVVLVHDAARPLTPVAVFERVLTAVRERGGGVIPVLPVVDTVRRVADHIAVGEVDRSSLVAVQTPQGFERAALVRAMADAVGDHTDDASVVASAGHAVTTVAGDPRAHKITTAEDLDAARVRVRAERVLRTGLGTDVHAFGDDELWLAGLRWPGERGLSGHSDGDAVGHAIVDALLSAAGLGDIGTHFGRSRPEFAGAHADVFLTETRRILATEGWRIENVAVQVQCASPRIAPRRAEAERVLSAALGAPVSLSATTTDGLGFTGRGDGVQAFATALIVRD